MRELWVEKYRPKTAQEYVFCDASQREFVSQVLKEKALPSLLLFGPAGTGKTTMAKMLLNELDVDPADILLLNGSSQNGVEVIRDTITNFVTVMPFGDFRYVLLDEADFLSPNAQAALRNLMEAYSNSARFIFTANYPGKIIPALHSRCQTLQIEKLNREDFTVRIAEILAMEGKEFDITTLDSFVAAAYPDMRKCINLAQQHTVSGKLLLADTGSSNASADYKLAAVELFKQRKYKEARTLICKQARPEEYEEFFTFMYQNLHLWADTDDKENEAIIIIRNGLAKAPLVADPEINLAATLTELSILANS